MFGKIERYLVGGAVRDEFLGRRTKDYDFSVEVTPTALSCLDPFDEMRDWIENHMGEVFVTKREFLTIRARDNGGLLTGMPGETADFVLCRADGAYSDGRRPDEVKVGTIFDDLARRDLTVNAIARNVRTGELIDPHGGRDDLEARILRAVGDPVKRLEEDALRALRVLRFKILLDFDVDPDLMAAMLDPDFPALLESVSVERKYDELRKCFEHDILRTMAELHALPESLREAMLPDRLDLKVDLVELTRRASEV